MGQKTMSLMMAGLLILTFLIVSGCGGETTSEITPETTPAPEPTPTEAIPAPEPEPVPTPAKTEPKVETPAEPEPAPALTPTAPTSEPASQPASTPGQNEVSDERITVVLDKLERADNIPDELVPPGYKKGAPSEGCDIVCIYLNIKRIENVYLLDPLRYDKDDKSFLLDANGHQYEFNFSTFQGATFKDPHDIKSPMKMNEGATVTVVFELPINEKPAKLCMVYSFNDVWETQSAKRGQIDIDLR
jgi:hypothetical protein